MRLTSPADRYPQACNPTVWPDIALRAPARTLALTLILTLITGFAVCPASASPNFVVILTDDQGWVGTSLQMLPADTRSKSDYYRTPNIERLAALGVTFSQGYAPAASCTPTRRSILIGQSPARHIYNKNRQHWPISYRQQLSIPRMLKIANPNYRSAHFGKWDMRTDNVTPQEMGYDVSDGYTENSDGGGKFENWPATQEDPKSIWGITSRAINFMAEQAKTGHPFYLQVSHYAVHLGIFYRAQTLAQVQKWPKGRKHTMPEFAAMTSDLDSGIGLLLDSISSLGLSDSTYIFFLSDNGGRPTLPGEVGQQDTRNFPLRNGKQALYEGGIRVPFIVAGPGIDKQVVSTVAVTGLDLLPTLADLAAYPDDLPAAVDGGSMKPVLTHAGKGEVSRHQPFLIFHQAVDKPPQSALILGDYKLIKSWARDRLELFDLATDIGETIDLSQRMPEKTSQLHALMERYLADVGAQTQGQEKHHRRDPALEHIL